MSEVLYIKTDPDFFSGAKASHSLTERPWLSCLSALRPSLLIETGNNNVCIIGSFRSEEMSAEATILGAELR